MGNSFRVLIADDSASIRNLIQEALSECQEASFAFIEATNGQEACTKALDNKPDLVVMDLEMPIMDGITAIKKIRENRVIGQIPIIVMSSTKLFQKAILAGANDFLIKPFTSYELVLRTMQNLALAEKENQVKQQNELLRKQKIEATQQRDTIIQQKAELLEDLQYARVIQKAILPSDQILANFFSDFFVFDRPRNIVSGDFYWAYSKKGKIAIAVGDCTGHGMSGALMTIAGTAFLSEIVSQNDSCSSNYILDELREKVIQLLNQKGEIGEVSNGMDMALCIYDPKEEKLQFTGAYNSLVVARQGQPIEQIKGDRMPIGYFFDYKEPFSNVEVKVKKGDSFFLYSDGYQDQFGGKEGRKFRSAPFYSLLTEAAKLSKSQDQKLLITNTMNAWIENQEQVDDMFILGITI